MTKNCGRASISNHAVNDELSHRSITNSWNEGSFAEDTLPLKPRLTLARVAIDELAESCQSDN